jgi:hypothetical protein
MKSDGAHINKGSGQVAGIPTHYWMEGSGFKPQWVQHFPYPSRLAQTPTPPPVQLVPGLFPGSKVAREWYSPPNLF